jgi:hypothetical protein
MFPKEKKRLNKYTLSLSLSPPTNPTPPNNFSFYYNAHNLCTHHFIALGSSSFIEKIRIKL